MKVNTVLGLCLKSSLPSNKDVNFIIIYVPVQSHGIEFNRPIRNLQTARVKYALNKSAFSASFKISSTNHGYLY